MCSALEGVGATLGHHVHESACRAPELRVGALAGDHELLHRIEIEGEGRALSAALLSKERIVEVGSVHAHVVVDAALAGDRERVAVGALRGGDTGRQQDERQEIAPVVRNTVHHSFGQRGRQLGARRIDGGSRLVGHIHGRQFRDAALEGE